MASNVMTKCYRNVRGAMPELAASAALKLCKAFRKQCHSDYSAGGMRIKCVLRKSRKLN